MTQAENLASQSAREIFGLPGRLGRRLQRKMGRLAPEKALEGKEVIQTEELNLTAVQAVEAYEDLTEIERSFRELKDLVEMRPIYHRRAQRACGHTFSWQP